MKKIVAINASPRPGWNTGTLVREARREQVSRALEEDRAGKQELLTQMLADIDARLSEDAAEGE